MPSNESVTHTGRHFQIGELIILYLLFRRVKLNVTLNARPRKPPARERFEYLTAN